MAIKKVELSVSQLIEDLNNGLTWYKKEDVGCGSIQEKYDAKDQQIDIIRKHPKLQNVEPNFTVFTIVDDTEPAPDRKAEIQEKIKSGETVVAHSAAAVGGFAEFSNL